MLSKLRPRSVYDVFALLGLLIATGGTGAYAANTIRSTDIVDGEVASVDIKNQDIKSADVLDQSLTTFDVSTFLGADVVDGTLTGDDVANLSLTGFDIAEGSVDGGDIANNSLTGNDITDSSINNADIQDDSLTGTDINEASLVGVKDKCDPPLTDLFGELCAGGDGTPRTYEAAIDHCASFGLRVPSMGEARLLATNHDVPGVGDGSLFWTADETFIESDGLKRAIGMVFETGDGGFSTPTSLRQVVCVSTPTDL